MAAYVSDTEYFNDIESIKKAVEKIIPKHLRLEVRVAEEYHGARVSIYERIGDRILGIQRIWQHPVSLDMLTYSTHHMLRVMEEDKPYMGLREKLEKHYKGQELDDMYYMFKKRDIEYKMKQKREELWQRSSLYQKTP